MKTEILRLYCLWYVQTKLIIFENSFCLCPESFILKEKNKYFLWSTIYIKGLLNTSVAFGFVTVLCSNVTKKSEVLQHFNTKKKFEEQTL